MTKTSLEWTQNYERGSEWVEQLALEVLPALSTADARELLKEVLPLRQLTPHQAVELVIIHLVNRIHSTSSRPEISPRF